MTLALILLLATLLAASECSRRFWRRQAEASDTTVATLRDMLRGAHLTVSAFRVVIADRDAEIAALRAENERLHMRNLALRGEAISPNPSTRLN